MLLISNLEQSMNIEEVYLPRNIHLICFFFFLPCIKNFITFKNEPLIKLINLRFFPMPHYLNYLETHPLELEEGAYSLINQDQDISWIEAQLEYSIQAEKEDKE